MVSDKPEESNECGKFEIHLIKMKKKKWQFISTPQTGMQPQHIRN
jgi:hypothetical protein